ncbi:NADPH:quinone reductase [Tranquillimonas rosea]|uniref:NADPH:quinone reductase n=1 Tax=Tranquillimonas rosea TaxID=641238 RepID=A0A1H9PKT6_9RHOB|nr:NAD(P)-dependent alcohol dehydrogenase [Tranquillimonas rosea]SER48747.1 NADPH:quinone reductase [Tranquillimonas rosea]
MRAVIQNRYGSPQVLRLGDVPDPEPGPEDLRVAVEASAVTTGDWRLRAAAYPPSLWLPGRLYSGLRVPKHKVPGTVFAGHVESTGSAVSRFSPGDRVFGMTTHGTHAALVCVGATSCVARIPDALSTEEAAALPFGALSALVFLRDMAALRSGERLMVIGATGGVGIHAVQIGRAFGADVTAVASAASLPLASDMGASHLLDYALTDVLSGRRRYDVILDTIGTASFLQARRALRPGGRFVPLNFGLADVAVSLASQVIGSRRLRIGIGSDRQADLEKIAGLVSSGQLHPVIDGVWPLDRIGEAHARVESRHTHGAVILRMPQPDRGA